MGKIMVVQAIRQEEDSINFVQIPNGTPSEIIEQDGLLVLEKSMHKLEDRMMVTARTVLGMNTELKTQIYEIDRIEKTLVSMHEFMVMQQDKIESLEDHVMTLEISKGIRSTDDPETKPSIWSRLFHL